MSSDKPKWWQRLLLWFKPMHWKEDTPLMTIGYKWLYGQMVIYKVIPHPPFHPNCRCIIL